ncbi:hypothetical protein NP493_2045g00001 [Ridgeia piscesae]|uniref:Uncharacterized protein n=1 Tax=Ridgeia piscesae TaxID=27915 RepID=A0AAD9JMC3_RIDPI|nr:hypothetical protein NP493_2045g00001 [Ridgeia piscesae]
MRHTTDWTRSYLASATLGRERHTDSARVTTAEYPQEELLNPSVVLLRATSVSFSRNGGPDSYAAGLCEVVVIGHRHITCSNCPSTSTCNDVIGCDECDPGKQQPDCAKDCEPGTYGKNCEEDCGHCKEMKPCDINDGHCTTGCETWYMSDICKTYICK